MGGAASIRVSCYGLRNCVWQDSSVNARVSTCDGSDTFCFLVDVSAGGVVSETLCDRMLTAAEEGYGRGHEGPSGRLRNAVIAANQALFEHNLRVDGAHHVLARLCGACLGIGDAHLVILGDVGVVGVVEGSLVSTPHGEGSGGENPLPWLAGVQRKPRLDAYRSPFTTDDVLVLATRDVVDSHAPPDLLALLAGDGESLRLDESSLSGLGDGATIIVMGDAAAACRRLQEGSEDTHPLVALFNGVSQDQKHVSLSADESEEPASEGQASIAPVQSVSTEPDAGSEPMGAGESAIQVDDTNVVQADAFDGEASAAAKEPAQPRRRRPRLRLRLPQVDLSRAAHALGDGARRIGYKMEDWAVRVLPDKVPERPPASARQQNTISLSGRVLVVVAMAIPLVMLGVVIATRIDWESRQRDRFGDIQAVAQSQYDTAMTSENVAAKRQGLYDALATTGEGLAVEPGDEMLMSLKRSIEHQLDQINAVDRIYTFYKLAELEDGGGTWSDASRIVVRGIDLYVVNRGSDRVYRFLMNDVGDALQPLDSDPTLLRTGDIYGGSSVGEIVDMAWMQAGGQRTIDTFVVLDRTGTMYAYDPQQGIDALPVADSDTWMKPEAAGGYYGNLYVLDPLLNAILKYVPTDNAYTNPPTSYLNPNLGIDLTGAVDMTIDGNVYVLYAGGEVAKFYDGERITFTMNGLPSPMQSPSAIFVSGVQEPDAEGYVYVADTGNERVLQFDKDGNFVRQLKARLEGEEMKDVRGLYVDEESERILLVSGSGLWYGKLPSLGAQ